MNHAKHAGQQRDWLWLTIIIGAGIALRLTAIASYHHMPASDELSYKTMALNLVSGNGIVDGMGNHAMYNVGYPLFILAPIFYFIGENLHAVRILNTLLGGVTIILCYLVAKEAGAGRLGRLMAAVIWALYLPASVYVVYLAKENLMMPIMLGVLWCALRLERQASKGVAILCGVLFGVLALTGNAALSLAASVVLALLLSDAPTFHRVALATLILVTALITSGPWLMRNMDVIGAPVLNTNGGFNLYLGNNPSATGMFVSIAKTPRGPTWWALRKKGELHASEVLKHEAIVWIKTHPFEFAKLALKKASYFWMPPFHEGNGGHPMVETIARILWAIQYLVLLVAAICSILIRALRSRQLAILLFAVAGYTAVHMLFYVIFRYRVPIMPVIGIIAAFAIESSALRKWWPPNNSGSSHECAHGFWQR